MLFLIGLSGCLLCLSGCATRGPKVNLSFFYYKPCSVCGADDRYKQISYSLAMLDKSNPRITTSIHELTRGDGENVFKKEIQKRGITGIPSFTPVLFVNDSYVVGYDAIEAEIQKFSTGH